MEEIALAHIAFRGRVTEQHSIDAGKIAVPVRDAGARSAELRGVPAREIDALRRCRMGCEKVQFRIGRLERVAESAEGFHRLQEAGGRIRIVAGPADVADAEGIGLQFLVAREAGKAQLPFASAA